MRIANLPRYELQPEEVKRIDEIIKKYKGKKGALIPILQKIQEYISFIPVEAQRKVAKTLDIAEKDVYGVVTFYSLFSMVPRGKYNIRVCMGTACFVKDGKRILDKLVKEFGIEPGQTTADRNYSLQINRCLGACGLASIIVVNDKFYQKVNPEKVIDIVYSCEK